MQTTTTTTTNPNATAIKWYTFNVYFTLPDGTCDIAVVQAGAASQHAARLKAVGQVIAQYNLHPNAINGTACVSIR